MLKPLRLTTHLSLLVAIPKDSFLLQKNTIKHMPCVKGLRKEHPDDGNMTMAFMYGLVKFDGHYSQSQSTHIV